MANEVMFDINGINDVADSMGKGSEEFSDEYQNTLNQIKWLRETFVGTVSDSFGTLVTTNDQYFRSLIEVLEECKKVLQTNASHKESNVEALQRQIQTNNYFEGDK